MLPMMVLPVTGVTSNGVTSDGVTSDGVADDGPVTRNGGMSMMLVVGDGTTHR